MLKQITGKMDADPHFRKAVLTLTKLSFRDVKETQIYLAEQAKAAIKKDPESKEGLLAGWGAMLAYVGETALDFCQIEAAEIEESWTSQNPSDQ